MIKNTRLQLLNTLSSLLIISPLMFASPAFAQSKGLKDKALAPASTFDLSHWNITLPVDHNRDGKVDTVNVKDLRKYSHPDFFYMDESGGMVFTAPNKGAKTKNTSNTRSELRHMLRGKNTRHKTHSGKNNFAVEARRDSDKFGSVGGKLEATLKVDHVALHAGNPNKNAAYSVVVGQIHAVKYENTKSGFGFGNEPLKIYYKKWPGHNHGSVFWNYERNLAKDDPNRTDISYPVWGNTWENPNDPGAKGISLGEEFSYEVNVFKNTTYLTFTSANHPVVTYNINLANNVDANGQIDPLDNRQSYGGDSLYFKAGVYNQCSTKDAPGVWYAACAGTGDWETDKENGDYAQATFSRLVVGSSTAP